MSKTAEKYGLESPDHVAGDLDDYLALRWQGTGERSRASFRDLSEWFNKRVLRTVYRTHDRNAGSTTINSDYRVLRGTDDVEEYERVGLLTELEADGIDGEEVVSDFISHMTLSRHIRNCLEVESTQATSGGSSDPREQLRKAKAQFESRIEEILGPLATREEIDGIEESAVETPVYLSCPHCPTRVRVDQGLEKGYVCSEHHQSPQDDVENQASER